MKQSKLIINSITEPFPQPSSDDLTQEPTRYVAFNDFWWRIFPLHWLSLKQAHLWPDLTDHLEQSILDMITPVELPPGDDCPECPECPNIWAKTFDFTNSGEGWVAIGGTPGAYAGFAGAWQLASSGALFIEYVLPSTTTILGMSMEYRVQGTSINKNARLVLVDSGGAIEIASIDPPVGTWGELAQSGRWENIWSIRARTQIGGGGTPNQFISRVTVWGEGISPF